jgi:hypothetical protein
MRLALRFMTRLDTASKAKKQNTALESFFSGFPCRNLGSRFARGYWFLVIAAEQIDGASSGQNLIRKFLQPIIWVNPGQSFRLAITYPLCAEESIPVSLIFKRNL